MISFYELSNSSQDLDFLKSFYNETYVFEFPDPNERESLENMQRYLNLKASGWYGKNNYHIIVAFQEEIPVGGSIMDFLAEPNVGIIEFIFIVPQLRNQGIGIKLLNFVESLLIEDAQKNLGKDIDCIVGEMNDPFQLNEVEDNLDPALRAIIWHGWGYRVLDFPYIQPALSDSQEPVSNLLLIAKIFRKEWQQAVPSYEVKLIVHEFLYWAMRLENPSNCTEYQNMANFLDARPEIPTIDMASYVGNNPLKHLSITPIISETDQDFWGVMSVYKDAFNQSLLAIQTEDFIQALHSVQDADIEYNYNLWAIRAEPTSKIAGMASFFTFPIAGFGGYIVFDRSLRGTGRLRELVARMELQMLKDQANTKGWYIETNSPQFLQLGFREIDVEYELPPLAGQEVGLKFRLFYKPYGRVYDEVKLTCDEFLMAMEQIFQIVYQIKAPRSHPSYTKLEACINSFQDGQISFVS